MERGTAETNGFRVFMLYGAGLVASLQLGKVAPVGPMMQASLDLSLTPLLLAIGFGTTAAVAVALLGLLPTCLITERGASAAAAGTATAAVSLCSLGGGLAAGWLLRRRIGLRSIAPLALLMPLGTWLIHQAGGSHLLSIAAGGAVLLVNGILISAIFAAVPQIVRSAADIGLANGLIVQFGSIGGLAGPPLSNAGVAAVGWPAVTALTLALSVGGGAPLVAAGRPAPVRV